MSNDQKARDEKNAQTRLEYLERIHRLAGNEDFRILLYRLKHSAGFDLPATSRNNGAIDPYATHFRDGRHSVLKEIDADIRLAEEAIGKGKGVSKPKTRT